MAELRGYQRAIQVASSRRADGWRHEMVAERRRIGVALGELSAMIAGRPATAGLDALRRAVSGVRAALAEHQALWPAVSLDPTDGAYIASVKRVRATYEQLDTALAGTATPPRQR